MSDDKQGKLFGRAVKIKDEKEKKEKEGTGLKISSLSYSAMRDYLKCPKLFYYRHVMKLRLPQKQMELVFGSAVHSAFESFAKSEDPYLAFTKEFDATKLNPDERDRMDEYDLEGKRLIKIFVESQDYLQKVHGIILKGTAEQKFRTWLIDPITKQRLPIQFSGRTDFETEADQILDYKTSSKPYKQEEVDDGDHALQADIYSLEFLARKGFMPKEFIFVVFVKGRKDPLQVMKTVRTKESMSRTFKTAELVINGVRGNQFPRGSGWMHKFCDCSKYEASLLI